MSSLRFHSIGVVGGLAFSFVLSGPATVSAQVTTSGLDSYRHTYDPEHGYVPLGVGYGGAYGGYPGWGGAMTPGMGAGIGAGAALSGYGQAAAGVGQLHVSNAQAQDIHQQAVTEYLQNANLAQQTAIETSTRREQTREQRNEAEKSHERAQLALYNKTLEQMSAAHRLTAEQFDMSRGVLHWPFVLRGPQYSDLRMKIDQLYAERTPEDSGTDSSTFDEIEQSCKQMQDLVNKQVQANNMPINDFVTAKHFISSIEYEARFKVKPDDQ